MDETGVISFVERNCEHVHALKCSKKGWEGCEMVRLPGEGFFFPGFVGKSQIPQSPDYYLHQRLRKQPSPSSKRTFQTDAHDDVTDTHVHASQHPNTGIFGKTTLLDWLTTYTFPLESRLSSPSFSLPLLAQAVSRSLSHGTTTASYFSTVHVPATNLLALICRHRGQRALVGRVCMDCPDTCPDALRDESAAEGVRRSRESIEYCRALDPGGELIRPIITPRFAPSCTPEALSGLGALAAETGALVQTHVAENVSECALVAGQYPDCKSYVDVYEQNGLLRDNTILAHGVWFSAAERRLIRARGAGVSHCPLSNIALGSGMCPVRKLMGEGVKVGLGSDVSGGWSESLLENVRGAVGVSRLVGAPVPRARYFGGEEGEEEPWRTVGPVDEDAKLSVAEALWLGTRGGADVVGLKGKVGGFEVGMEWDAQMVLLNQMDPACVIAGVGKGKGGLPGVWSPTQHLPVDVYGWESWEDKVSKWVFCGDDRNTAAVWVKGRLVHRTERFEEMCTGVRK